MPDTLLARVENLYQAALADATWLDAEALRELFRQRDALLAAAKEVVAMPLFEYRHQMLPKQRAALGGLLAAAADCDGVEVGCPDCGTVRVLPDIFEHGKPISAECPKCGDRLNFAAPAEAATPRPTTYVPLDEDDYDPMGGGPRDHA